MKLKFFLIFAVFFSYWFIHNINASALASDPYEVPAAVKKAWLNQDIAVGDKSYKMETGKNISYDIYNNKFTKGGYDIVENKKWTGGKAVQYIRFYGWAVNFGYTAHSNTNHETYIGAVKKGTNERIIFATVSKKDSKGEYYDATWDLAYNRAHVPTGQLWNECPSGTKNKDNLTCNMRYKNAIFTAYVPIEKLFPDTTKAVTWNLYLIKRVNNHMVYTKLFIPFKFKTKNYGLGQINMTSGVNADILTMNSYPVIKRTAARKNESGAQKGYFLEMGKYRMVDANEKKIPIWYGVNTDSVAPKVRWAASAYWNFGGKQAAFEYVPKFKPSIKFSFKGKMCKGQKQTPVMTVVTGKGKEIHPLASDSTLKWSSSNKKVITIEKGTWKAVGKGTSKIKVIYHDPTLKKDYSKSASVTVNNCDTPPPPPPTGSCKVTIETPTIAFKKELDAAKPSTAGSISAEENFDVSHGIPVTEQLKTQASSERYIFKQRFQNKTGNVILKVDVAKTYNLKWTEEKKDSSGVVTTEDKTEEKQVKKTVTLKRPYSYWDIGKLQFYKLNDMDLFNYALVEQVSTLAFEEDIDAEAANEPDYKLHVTAPECDLIDLGKKEIDGGKSKPAVPDEDFMKEADKKIGKAKVKNDFVSVEGNTIMDETETEEKAPTPKDIPKANKVDLTERNIVIPDDRVNWLKSPSQGKTWYSRMIDIGGEPGDATTRGGSSADSGDTGSGSTIEDNEAESNVGDGEPVNDDDQWYEEDDEGDGDTGENDGDETVDDSNNNLEEDADANDDGLEFEFSVNPVTIHTPIVLHGNTSDEVNFDQRIDRSLHDKNALILDRQFTVNLSANGSHRSIPGYGTRDYSKYVSYKEVKFPFDVYNSSKTVFYPANTWIKISADTTSMNYHLPIWVPEGKYTIDFREYAINAPSGNEGKQTTANTTIPLSGYSVSPAGSNSAAHMVTDSKTIDVIGRVYDFRVTDVTDYNWENVFRTKSGSVEHSNNYFWVGDRNRDGENRGNNPAVTLPIAQGKHTAGIKNVAVKTGYSFKFDFKTMGNMFGKSDAIRITPKFYFVDKNGQNRREVDLYYHGKNDFFVKVGSNEDKTYRTVKLNDPYRNISTDDLTLTADYYYRHAADFDLTDKVNGMYYSSFIRNYIRKDTKEETITGPYGWQILNKNLRNYIGPKKENVPSTGTMILKEDTIRSEQKWYSEYSLPAKVYAVDKDVNVANMGLMTRLSDDSSLFLKNGYIIVNFDIETIRNGEVNKPYLKYVNGNVSNQWKREGFKYNYVDPYNINFTLKDGDVVFYHADKSANDDWNSSVTH